MPSSLRSCQLAVVGGGIGGLAAALAAARAGRTVTLVERATRFGEIGAGLQLAPNASLALDELGVLADVQRTAVTPPRLVMMDAVSGVQITELDLRSAAYRERFRHPYLVTHRTDLHAALLAACQSHPLVTLHTGHTVTRAEQDDSGVRLHFEETLSLDEAERRVLMLVNPGLTDPPATVNTLYAGLQIILPGETAQAHRHTSNAFRFILEGSGAWTTVNGEPVHMAPGDLLLTPGWYWHDHTHRGDAPMIWLDALDYPLVNALEAGFYEKYPQRLQPVTRPDDAGSRQFLHGRLTPAWLTPDGPNSPVTRYTWTETARALDAIADTAEGSDVDGIVLEYTNPWTGGPVMPTIGCRIHRLRPGFQGAGSRHTASTVFNVVRGEGATLVDGVRLDWSQHDTFAVPGWSSYRHINTGPQDAVLFSYSDEPVMRSLGLYRAEPADPGA